MKVRSFLSVANGEPQITTFKWTDLPWPILVTEWLNMNFILGFDWLHVYGVRMYFDLQIIRIVQTYVKLEEDIRIASTLWLDKKLIKRQTAAVWYVKWNNKGFGVSESGLIETSNWNMAYNGGHWILFMGENG